MSTPPNPVLNAVAKTAIVDKNGKATWEFLKLLMDWGNSISKSINNLGEIIGPITGTIANTAKVQGRTEGIGTTLGNIDGTGVITNNGIDLSRAYQNKTFSNIDGQVASNQQVVNAQLNATNFCTVDSIDNGSSATIRVYDAVSGVPLTPWIRQVGTQTFGPYPALQQAGMAYSTGYYVMFDPASGTFRITQVFADTLDDHLIFCGAVKTVAAGGTGGTTGGGGATGGSGGACFSGDVGVLTPTGVVKFKDLPEFFIAKTRKGWRAAQLQKHFHDGVMHYMGDKKYVTPAHPFAHKDGWIPARAKYLTKILYTGTVYNATIQTNSEDEREYTLETGEVVHNMSPFAP